MPKVSVIIPTFNREKYITHAVESVLRQSFRDYEIIVIDDGSTDGTRPLLEPYLNHIRYIRQENAGVSAARNTGLKLARGEWIAFLDSDDEWLPSYLSYQMELVGHSRAICLAITNSIQIRKDGSHVETFKDKESNLCRCFDKAEWLIIPRPLEFVLKHHITNLQATVIRRSALLDAGAFDRELSIAEDLDVIARVSLQGALAISNEPLVVLFRRHESTQNLTSQLFSLKGQTAFGVVYEKLRRRNGLTYTECHLLDKMRSANQRAIGNLLVGTGELERARDYYRQSLLVNPSLRNLAKYLVSFLPINVVRRSIRTYEQSF